MTLRELKNKLVAILGYGMEGKAVAAYLLKHGIKPVLFDQRPWAEWNTEEQEAVKALGINFIFGPDAFLELKGFDIAFRSPGIKISEVANEKLELTSQTKFFFDNCPAKIIGVTGTKGKGTTSALIYEMLKLSSKAKISKTFLTGNIGKDQPLDFLDSLENDDWVVYELSSFQLQDLGKSPHIAVVLMVTSEHLDYHLKLKDYHAAKTPIAKFQGPEDFAVINADFPASMAIGAAGKGKKFYFSRQKELKIGAYVKKDEVVIAAGGAKAEVFKISGLQIMGRHNLENVCASALAANLAGCNFKAIKKAAFGFKGLPHRLELASEKEGIKFYDDSFSTTPETAVAAIESFAEPLILILGGSSKNSNFSQLSKAVQLQKNIKTIILIGREAAKIKDCLLKPGKQRFKIFEGAISMEDVFSQIRKAAKKGDVVLLSPACASFDMFKDYKDRGEQFKEQVKKW